MLDILNSEPILLNTQECEFSKQNGSESVCLPWNRCLQRTSLETFEIIATLVIVILGNVKQPKVRALHHSTMMLETSLWSQDYLDKFEASSCSSGEGRLTYRRTALLIRLCSSLREIQEKDGTLQPHSNLYWNHNSGQSCLHFTVKWIMYWPYNASLESAAWCTLLFISKSEQGHGHASTIAGRGIISEQAKNPDRLCKPKNFWGMSVERFLTKSVKFCVQTETEGHTCQWNRLQRSRIVYTSNKSLIQSQCS